jgi:two-component SAPR family response regulator
MPYKNGIDIAKELRLKNKDVNIAFVTDLAQMAVKGFEVDAVDFIIKPVEYSGLSISSDSRVFFFLFQ